MCDKTELILHDDDEQLLSYTTDENVIQKSDKKSTKTKNPPVPKTVTKNEKRLVARLVEKEAIIWDLRHELHSNVQATKAAWDRVAENVPNRNALECKGTWKSLRDSHRYRRKRKFDGSGNEVEATFAWEFDDCMQFLTPMPSKYPRSTTVIDLENISNKSNGSTSVTTNDGSSVSHYSYAGRNKKDLLAESVVHLSKSIKDFVNCSRSTTQQHHNKPLTFDHIWANLDKLFEKMKPEDVDELNVKYMQLAFDMLQKQKNN